MTWSLLFVALLVASPTPLTGIDTIPTDVVVDVVILQAVAVDRGAGVVARSRAVRLLSLAALDVVEVDTTLAMLATTTTGELEVQIALARFDRAARRSPFSAAAMASSSSSSSSAALRKVSALMWWRIGGGTARAALERCASADSDPGARGACRGRLRAWSRSGPSPSAVTAVSGTSTSDVLHDKANDGSSASSRR